MGKFVEIDLDGPVLALHERAAEVARQVRLHRSGQLGPARRLPQELDGRALNDVERVLDA